MKKNYGNIIFIFFSCIILAVIIAIPTKTEAFCAYCDGDEDMYKYQKQFAERIKIIKGILGKSVDEVALAATVLHKENALQAMKSRYETDFDSNEYKTYWQGITKDKKQYSEASNPGGTSRDVNSEQVDLLNAAAIIMADSAGWINAYDEEAYKKALAGSRLVGNNVAEGDVIGNGVNEFYNWLFCGVGFGADAIFSFGNMVFQLATGKDVIEEAGRTSTRFYNMGKICANGYIGGVYGDIEVIKDEKQKQAYKDQKAQEIIDFIHYYKEIRGNVKDACPPSNIGAAESSNWKQADPEWGSIQLGSGNNMANIGCLITSLAIHMSNSGTQILNLPSGFSAFNPGALVTTLNNNNGFVGAGAFTWGGFTSIAPNWRVEASAKNVNTSDNAELAKVLSEELSTPADGQYQKFLVIQFKHDKSDEHWVVVDNVSGDTVYIKDPGGPSGNTLDANYSGWFVKSYKVMYATDVLFGQAGTSTDEICPPTGGDFAGFIASVEGTAECNYKGRGEGTGYQAYNLNDGAGMTTAMGITERYQKDVADNVGYTGFISDMHSGCTDKTYIDKMFPTVLEKYSGYVDANSDGLNLTSYERDAMTSLTYGGFNLFNIMANKIKGSGKESFEVFDCFKSRGCSWFASGFDDGLVRRRMAEYELFRKANYNAAKPTETYSYFTTLNNKSKMDNYIDTHWPTSRG